MLQIQSKSIDIIGYMHLARHKFKSQAVSLLLLQLWQLDIALFLIQGFNLMVWGVVDSAHLETCRLRARIEHFTKLS